MEVVGIFYFFDEFVELFVVFDCGGFFFVGVFGFGFGNVVVVGEWELFGFSYGVILVFDMNFVIKSVIGEEDLDVLICVVDYKLVLDGIFLFVYRVLVGRDGIGFGRNFFVFII